MNFSIIKCKKNQIKIKKIQFKYILKKIIFLCYCLEFVFDFEFVLLKFLL